MPTIALCTLFCTWNYLWRCQQRWAARAIHRCCRCQKINRKLGWLHALQRGKMQTAPSKPTKYNKFLFQFQLCSIYHFVWSSQFLRHQLNWWERIECNLRTLGSCRGSLEISSNVSACRANVPFHFANAGRMNITKKKEKILHPHTCNRHMNNNSTKQKLANIYLFRIFFHTLISLILIQCYLFFCFFVSHLQTLRTFQSKVLLHKLEKILHCRVRA